MTCPENQNAPGDGYRILDRLTPKHFDQLVELYQHEWWSKGRCPDDVRRMLTRTSLHMGMVDRADDLIGFARVLTDEVYWALVFDVIVRQDHRGKGLGDRLMKSLLSHPRVRKVRSVALCCRPELVQFYRRHGFVAEPSSEIVWLRRKN